MLRLSGVLLLHISTKECCPERLSAAKWPERTFLLEFHPLQAEAWELSGSPSWPLAGWVNWGMTLLPSECPFPLWGERLYLRH